MEFASVNAGLSVGELRVRGGVRRAEDKNGAAGDDAIVVMEPGAFGGPPIDKRTVAGIQVLEQVIVAIAHDNEMAAGEGGVVDADIGGSAATD